MRMDKLTSKFQMALADAQSLAVGRDHNIEILSNSRLEALTGEPGHFKARVRFGNDVLHEKAVFLLYLPLESRRKFRMMILACVIYVCLEL